MSMNISLGYLRCLCIVPALMAYGAAQAENPLCATASLDTILQASQASKAAQERIRHEFDQKFSGAEPLTAERKRTEQMWLEAKKSGRPDDEVNTLKSQYDQALKAERDTLRPLRQALEDRKEEELRVLVQRASDIYKRIGIEQGFKVLLQVGEQEPAFIFDKSTRLSSCDNPIDLTPNVMKALDQGETKNP